MHDSIQGIGEKISDIESRILDLRMQRVNSTFVGDTAEFDEQKSILEYAISYLKIKILVTIEDMDSSIR